MGIQQSNELIVVECNNVRESNLSLSSNLSSRLQAFNMCFDVERRVGAWGSGFRFCGCCRKNFASGEYVVRGTFRTCKVILIEIE